MCNIFQRIMSLEIIKILIKINSKYSANKPRIAFNDKNYDDMIILIWQRIIILSKLSFREIGI